MEDFLRIVILSCLLLTILFVVLKVNNKISWSWFWVLSPIWFPLAIVVGILIANGLTKSKKEEET